MAPTQDVTITIPTLEGITAALMVLYRTLTESNILTGLFLIIWSFYRCLKSIDNIVQAIFASRWSGDGVRHDTSKYQSPEDYVLAIQAQSYKPIGVIYYVELDDETREDEPGFLWSVFSWALFIGGIFVMTVPDGLGL